jgi:hypothetical protein
MKGVLARLIGALALAALLGVEAIPVAAAPASAACSVVLDVANPAAGVRVPRGRLNISGVAYDKNARTGTGVDMVTAFLGDRDLGGSAGRPGGYLGAATLGLANPNMASGQFSKAGFNLKTLSLRKGKWTLFIYARGGNCESVVTIPIKVDVN